MERGSEFGKVGNHEKDSDFKESSREGITCEHPPMDFQHLVDAFLVGMQRSPGSARSH